MRNRTAKRKTVFSGEGVQVVQRDCGVSVLGDIKPAGCGPELLLMLLWAGGLDLMIFRGPFQPQSSCNSVKNIYIYLLCAVHCILVAVCMLWAPEFVPIFFSWRLAQKVLHLEREGLFVWNFQSKECAPFSKPIYLGCVCCTHQLALYRRYDVLVNTRLSISALQNQSVHVCCCMSGHMCWFFILGKKKKKKEDIPVRIWPRASLGMSDFFWNAISLSA